MKHMDWLWAGCFCLSVLVGCGGQAPEPTPNVTVVSAALGKADGLLGDAQQAFKANDFKKALETSTLAFELYQKTSEAPPAKVNQAREVMGSSALALGDYEKASVAFGALAMLDPSNQTAKTGLATAQAALDKQRAAAAAASAAREKKESEERRRQAAARQKATAAAMQKASAKPGETRAVAYGSSGSGPAVQYKTVGGKSMYLYTDPKSGLPVQSETPPKWYKPGCSNYVILCDQNGRKLDMDPIPQNEYLIWEGKARRAEQQARSQAQIQAMGGRSPSGPVYPGQSGYRPTYPGASYPPGYRAPGYPNGYRGPSVPGPSVPGPAMPGPSMPGRR